MKKTLALVMLAGLMLTGCGGKQAAAQSVATPSASAVAVETPTVISVPDVVGMTLDKATDKIKAVGLQVDATDADNGKTIIIKRNWEVITQAPGYGVAVASDSVVELGVRHLTDPTPTPTPTPTKAPAKLVAPAPVVKAPAPAPKAPVYKAPPPVVVAPVAPPAYSGIICRDGYAWPGTTRQGACRGHGGIAN